MSDFMSLSLPGREQDKFKGWINSLKEENEKESKRIIIGQLYKIQRRAMMLAPVDKGFLRRGIRVNINTDPLNRYTYGGSVYTATKYAPYQEWGTGTGVSVPSYVKSMFGVDSMEWKGKGIRKVNMKRQPFLFFPAKIGYEEMLMKLENMGFKKV